MSECKICLQNGHPGIKITWNDKLRNQKTGRHIPLETDGSTYHRHFEPTNGNGGNSNPTPAVVKTISPTNTTVPKIESLNQINFAEVLSEILGDYIKLKRQEVGAGKQ